jgi:hypothetical protein
MNNDATPREVGSSEGLGPNAQAVERDPHRGGSSYEASMLRNLLARIHGDGGHYVEQHGLEKALEDADTLVAAWRAAPDDMQWLTDNQATLEYKPRKFKWGGPPHWWLSWGDYSIARLTPKACIAEARAIQTFVPNASDRHAPPPIAWASDALRDVAAERRRQIDVEGWTPEHDDEHKGGEMACAAAAYAVHSSVPKKSRALWGWTGWAANWFKPKDTRHNLIRAAALLLAEIERLDRAA